MEAWRAQVRAENVDLNRYPGTAASYVFKNEAGDPVVSMDGSPRVFAHYLPAVVQASISQPASDGKAKITLIYQHLETNRKCLRASFEMRIAPDEPEQGLLDRRFGAVRRDNSTRLPRNWKQYLMTQSKSPSDYEWYTGNMLPLQKRWWDQ
jgi:hypothetical protein